MQQAAPQTNIVELQVSLALACGRAAYTAVSTLYASVPQSPDRVCAFDHLEVVQAWSKVVQAWSKGGPSVVQGGPSVVQGGPRVVQGGLGLD